LGEDTSESKPLLAQGFHTALDAYRATAARSLSFLSSPALLKARSRDHFSVRGIVLVVRQILRDGRTAPIISDRRQGGVAVPGGLISA